MIKNDIMQSQHYWTEHFACIEKVSYSRFAERFAADAAAGCVNRGKIVNIGGISQSDCPILGKSKGISAVSGWHYAVEHIDPCPNCLNNIRRRAYAHQVAGLVFGQQRGGELDCFYHL